MTSGVAGVALLVGIFLSGVAAAEKLQPVAEVTFSGGIKAPEDLSAVAKFEDFLIVGSDEAHRR